jgi:acyl carrier protein
MSTIQTLRAYFAKEIPQAKKDIGDDESLIEAGILDSMAIVKLVAYLEEQFGIELTDEEFDPDNFDSLSAIDALIQKKQSP